jgi:hypothetical protein
MNSMNVYIVISSEKLLDEDLIVIEGVFKHEKHAKALKKSLRNNKKLDLVWIETEELKENFDGV